MEKGTEEKREEEKRKDNHVVVINSFKGGAGKTTAALCRCVSEYKEASNHNIYYVDLDILGTGVEYVLSLKEQKRYYNDLGGEQKLEQKVQEIMRDERMNNRFFAAVLNPISRIKQTYGGQDRLRSHPDVEQGVFRMKVKTLINQILDCKGQNLIVMDCAPGISYMEENILEELYRIAKNPRKKLSVEEIFVTTPDSAHIQKTINNLNACAAYLMHHAQRVTLLVNDIFNCEGIERKSRKEGKDDFVFSRQMIMDYLKGEVKPPVDYLYMPYSEVLLKQNVIKNEAKLINVQDDYYAWPKYQD